MPTFLRKAPNIYEFEGFRFYPGINQVPEAEYKRWQEKCKESFTKYFSLQITGKDAAMTIVETPKGKTEEIANIVDLIAKSSVKKTLEIIPDILLIESLETALEAEKRKPVIDALTAQIAEMKRKPSAEELLGGVKPSTAPATGNLMDDLNISHEFTKTDKE
jgi:hypothetical protein